MNMWYSKEAGGFVRRVPGTDRVIKLGGAEDVAMQNSYQKERDAFFKEHDWDKRKNYMDNVANLEGMAQHASFGNHTSWKHALNDRLNLRKGGDYAGAGLFTMLGQSKDRQLFSEELAIGNTVEDMYRRGYSQAQIGDIMWGDRSAEAVLAEGPDWKDYNRHLEEYKATLGEGEAYKRQWFDDYYQGQDKSHLKRTFEWERPQATGGFLDAYAANKPAPGATPPAPASDAPAASERASVASLFDSFMNKRRGQ